MVYFLTRIIERIEDHTEMSISQSMRLGELREIVSMKIALVGRELQRVIGVENGIMIRCELHKNALPYDCRHYKSHR